MEAVLDREKAIVERLAAQFPGIDASRAAYGVRRIYLGVPEEVFLDALAFAAKALDFDHLCTITGLDAGDGFEFLYHIAEPGGIVLTLKYKVKREDPVVIPSVLPVYPGATFYEREVSGLLGVEIKGLPAGRQYPLPDNWPKGEYPLRKDWKPGSAKLSQPTPPQQGIPATQKPEEKGAPS